MESVGCSVPWIGNNTQICSDPSKIQAARESGLSFRSSKTCMKPCQELTIYIGEKNVEKTVMKGGKDVTKTMGRQLLYVAPKVKRRLVQSKESSMTRKKAMKSTKDTANISVRKNTCTPS